MRRLFVRARILGLAVCAISCVLISGCGGEKIPPLFAVSGKVTYNGKAVPGATVMFFPPIKPAVKGKKDDAPTVAPRRLKGYTDDDGNYELSWGEDHDEGVPAGSYKVAISSVEYEPGDDEDKPQVNKLPGKYANPETSGLTATVKDGGENTFDFKLDDSAGGPQPPQQQQQQQPNRDE